MKRTLFIFLVISMTNIFCSSTRLVGSSQNTDHIGFVLIDLSQIYHRGGRVVITDSTLQKTLIDIDQKHLKIGGRSYELIDEEYLYKQTFGYEVLNAEYGNLVFKCLNDSAGFLKISLGNKSGVIDLSKYSNVVDFQSFEDYIMSTHPVATSDNPVRVQPNEEAQILKDYDTMTFIPLEITGDWLKVKDNVDCYKNELPTSGKNYGWIRWRQNGKFILKVAHSC